MSKLDAMKKKAGTAVPNRAVAAPVMEKKHQYADVRLDDITINPKNCYAEKDTPEIIRQLAESIERQGMDHNIVLSRRKDGTLLLLSGERRLRAVRLLREDTAKNADGRYDRIRAKIYDGLDEVEEEIILDETNLEVRGTLDDPEIQRRTMARYVENLKKKYGLTQAQAQRLLAGVSGASDATIYRNMRLSFSLVPELQAFLEENSVRRTDILAFCVLPENEQSTVAAALRAGLDYLAQYPEQGRGNFEKLTEGCVAAAEGWREGDEPLSLADLTAPLLPPAAPAAVTPAKATALDKKAKTAAKYRKMAADLQKAGNGIRALRRLEALPEGESIAESLEEVIRQANALLSLLREV